MANVPYNPAPQAAAGSSPTPGLNVNAGPDAFGVDIGQATQRLGQSTEQAGNTATGIQVGLQERQNQIATGDAFNQFQNHVLSVTAGSPDKPDQKGYLALQGQDALTSYPTAVEAIETGRKSIGADLNDAQRIAFEEQSRRIQQYALSGMRTHFIQQQNKWGETTWQSQIETQGRFVAAHPDDPTAFQDALDTATSAAVKRAADLGITPQNPTEFMNFVNGAQAHVISARLDGLVASDPDNGAAKALDWFQNGVIPGTDHPVRDVLAPHQQRQIEAQLAARGESQQGEGIFRSLVAGQSPAPPGPAIYNAATAFPRAVATRTPVPLSAGPSGPPVSPDAVLPNVSAAIDRVAQKYPGVDTDVLRRTAMIESSGGRASTNVFQFIKSTAQGMKVDVNNLDSNTDGAARLQLENKAALTRSLGRAPTPAELYLAHQQGAGGAAALLRHPELPAEEALQAAGVPPDTALNAITGNGGKRGMSAGDFVNMWAQKFDGSTPASSISPTARMVVQREWNNYALPGQNPGNAGDVLDVNNRIVTDLRMKTGADPARFAVAYYSGLSNVAAPGSPTPYKTDWAGPDGQKTSAYVANTRALLDQSKADVVQQILDQKLPPRVERAALQATNQHYNALALAANVKTQAQTREDQDAAAEWMRTILSGDVDPTLPDQILKDQRLHNPTTIHTLHGLSLKALGQDPTHYTPMFLDALARVTDLDRPDRITDVGQLYSMVTPRPGPDGKPQPTLSLQDVAQLEHVMTGTKKNPDQIAVNQTQQALLKYAQDLFLKNRETFPGSGHFVTDPEMSQLFHGRFLPRFFSQYNDFMKDARAKPWDFLNEQKINEIANSVMPQAERTRRQLLFNGGPAPTPTDQSTLPPPPAPPTADENGEPWGDVDAGKWKVLMTTPPAIGGARMDRGKWAEAIQRILTNPKLIPAFDEKFAPSGYNGRRIVEGLRKPPGTALDYSLGFGM